FARLGGPARSPAPRAALLVIAALVCTAWFDLVTNLATGMVYGQTLQWLRLGLPFALIHLGTNAVLFGVVGTPLVTLLARHAARLAVVAVLGCACAFAPGVAAAQDAAPAAEPSAVAGDSLVAAGGDLLVATADRDSLRREGAPDAPASWSLAGRPGFGPEIIPGAGYPWALAGHVAGAWSIEDRLEAGGLAPLPGGRGVMPPLTGATSVATRWGGEGAWEGFGATLAKTSVEREGLAPGRGPMVSLFSFGRGSSAEARNDLYAARRDSTRFFAGQVSEWERGGVGPFLVSGAHRYALVADIPTSRVRLSGAFAQHGIASAVTSGEASDLTGAAGWLRLGVPLVNGEATLRVGRSYDHRESFGGILVYGRRDAQRAHVEAGWSRRTAAHEFSAVARFERAEVVRALTGFARTEWEEDELWTAARWRTPIFGGALEAALGAGHSAALSSSEWAPTLAWSGRAASLPLRLVAERIVSPVWSDLAPGGLPFRQSLWSGSAETEFRSDPMRVRLHAGIGRTEARVLTSRLPIEAWWLRVGARSDPEPSTFALVSAELRAARGPFELTADGFVLQRTTESLEARVDPNAGGRARLELRGRLFENDLEVRLRGDVAFVGTRESEAPTPDPLEAYVTFGAGVVATLGDVVMVVDARRLEDQPREEVWIDPLSGFPARGPGREFRFTFTWRFFD
ncbi:MAG: hypothetical protein HOP12_00220, partial [Candidatus Eisenbacteria bacterium]|nr:hypothetical protein [Candidatus Eisenbacteria bacterium]